MKQPFLRSITAALLTTAFGTAASVFGLSKAEAISSNKFALNQQPEAVSAASDSPLATQELTQALEDDLKIIEEIQPLHKGAGKPEPQSQSMVKQGGPSGMASWYGPGFHGRQTANGEIYNQNALTAAHPNLPFGTKVKVTNVHTGSSVVVRINDRGPFVGGRVIDLSAAAARVIGLVRSGVAPVRLEILGR